MVSIDQSKRIYVPTMQLTEKSNLIQKINNRLKDEVARSRGNKYSILFLVNNLLKLGPLLKLIVRNQFYLLFNHKRSKSNLLKELQSFGFAYERDSLLPLDIIEEINSYFEEKILPTIKLNKSTNANPLYYFPLTNYHSKLVLINLLDKYETTIIKYLNYSPYLKNISYMYSRNSDTFDDSSQFWHLDKQGTKTLKIFIALKDINIENGPLNFIDAQRSKYIDREFEYIKKGSKRRIGDEIIKDYFKNLKFNNSRFTADTGECLFLDTERCFHYGSRKSSVSRLKILIEFGSMLDYRVPNLKRDKCK